MWRDRYRAAGADGAPRYRGAAGAGASAAPSPADTAAHATAAAAQAFATAAIGSDQAYLSVPIYNSISFATAAKPNLHKLGVRELKKFLEQASRVRGEQM